MRAAARTMKARLMSPRAVLLAAVLACAGAAEHASAQLRRAEAGGRAALPVDWPQFAGGAARVARADDWASGIPDLSTPRWTADADHLGRPIAFVSQSGAVGALGRVLAVGLIDGSDHLVAFEARRGTPLWATPVPGAVFDSWATPAIDAERVQAIVASGSAVTAIDLRTGEVRWQTALPRPVVNASPCVAADLDDVLGTPDRVFITDYSFLSPSTGGRLYCLNLAPFDAVRNPHQPGEIVWTATLPGQTSGATPAYAVGRVFVATATGPGGTSAGRIVRYDASASATPPADWTFTNPQPVGFFGGVTVDGGFVYASSYSFAGQQLSANTVKLSAQTGLLRWSVPTNRSAVCPVPVTLAGVGRAILVSGGLADDPFLPASGSVPSVGLIVETGPAAASLAWDSALATHTDTNANGRIDAGEPHLPLGGWTMQPAVLASDGTALVGTLGEPDLSSFEPARSLTAINLSKLPTQAGFVVAESDAGGNSPAPARGLVFVIGPDGLSAFGAEASP